MNTDETITYMNGLSREKKVQVFRKLFRQFPISSEVAILSCTSIEIDVLLGDP